MKQIVLPNQSDNLLFAAMRESLAQGGTFRMRMGGTSMEPLIHGASSVITLAPLPEGREPAVGDVLMFLYEGRHIVHRLVAVNDGSYIFRGDNCRSCESVGRSALVALLQSVEYPDGTLLSCDTPEWKRRSSQLMRRRSRINRVLDLFAQPRRKWWSAAYFVLLALLMWLPLNGLDIRLDQYIFGLRADHLLHALVFLPCALFFYDWVVSRRLGAVRWLLLWLLSVATGLLTEFGQRLLPYRGFDVNDLAANAMGTTLGFLVLLAFILSRRRRRR